MAWALQELAALCHELEAKLEKSKSEKDEAEEKLKAALSEKAELEARLAKLDG